MQFNSAVTSSLICFCLATLYPCSSVTLINDVFQKGFEKWKLSIVLWRVNSFCPCVLSTMYSLRFIFEMQHLKVLLWGFYHAVCSSSLCEKSWLGLGLVSHMHQVVIQNKNTMIYYCSVLAHILASFSWKCFNFY